MVWLRSNTPKNSIIISSFASGNLIPIFSLHQVYLGHPHGTAQFPEKFYKVEQFFREWNDDEKASFLKENKIDYLFFGPEEKELSAFNPDEKSYLKKVFENSLASIYEVVK